MLNIVKITYYKILLYTTIIWRRFLSDTPYETCARNLPQLFFMLFESSLQLEHFLFSLLIELLSCIFLCETHCNIAKTLWIFLGKLFSSRLKIQKFIKWAPLLKSLLTSGFSISLSVRLSSAKQWKIIHKS